MFFDLKKRRRRETSSSWSDFILKKKAKALFPKERNTISTDTPIQTGRTMIPYITCGSFYCSVYRSSRDLEGSQIPELCQTNPIQTSPILHHRLHQTHLMSRNLAEMTWTFRLCMMYSRYCCSYGNRGHCAKQSDIGK